MNYARISDRPFVTRSDVHTRRKITAEAQSIRTFYEAHNFEVRIDPKTNKPKIEVTKADEE